MQHGSMLVPSNCGGSTKAPGRNCTSFGYTQCLGGQCLPPDCPVDVTNLQTSVALVISNSTVMSGYLSWYRQSGEYQLHPATVIPYSTYIPFYYRSSTIVPGQYDLMVPFGSLPNYVTFEPDSGYIYFQETTSKETSLWIADPCSGELHMNYGNMTYKLLVESTGSVYATPQDGLKPRDREGSQSQVFAGKPSSVTSQGPYRCVGGNPPQAVRRNDPSLASNGCGDHSFAGSLVPNYRFETCCNGHDDCYSDCTRSFRDCNSDFLNCMYDVCTTQSILVEGRLLCIAAAELYHGYVTSHLQPFVAATQQACGSCPAWPEDPGCKFFREDGAPCWVLDDSLVCTCGWPSDDFSDRRNPFLSH